MNILQGERRPDRAPHGGEVSRPARRAVGADAQARMTSRAGEASCDAVPRDRHGHRRDAVRTAPSRRTSVRARSGEGRGREPAAVHGAGGGGVRRGSASRYEVIVIDDGSVDDTLGACSQELARAVSLPAHRAPSLAPRDRRRAAHRVSPLARRRAGLLSGRPAVQARGHPAARRADPRRRSRTWSRASSRGSTRRRSCRGIYNRLSRTLFHVPVKDLNSREGVSPRGHGRAAGASRLASLHDRDRRGAGLHRDRDPGAAVSAPRGQVEVRRCRAFRSACSTCCRCGSSCGSAQKPLLLFGMLGAGALRARRRGRTRRADRARSRRSRRPRRLDGHPDVPHPRQRALRARACSASRSPASAPRCVSCAASSTS